jgi:dTDP-glucose 4,6-dehydratase
MLLVTGGCGFIGSAFILEWLAQSDEAVVNLDLLTYAAHLGNLKPVEADSRYHFTRGDIADAGLVSRLLREHRPRAVIHFAAESHVDRSIVSPLAFVQTNVVGTLKLLESVLAHSGVPEELRSSVSQRVDH